MPRVRLDQLLVTRGLAADPREAAVLLLDGSVLVDGQPGAKPGSMVRPDQVELRKVPPCRYVSRGGLKLEAALDAFTIDPSSLVCVDLGCSTGGFTDCLLQRGAARVFAFDVGKGVLDWKLRQDPRVILREGCNVRYLSAGALPETADLVTADLSFISLRLILPVLAGFAGAQCLLLVKPQFEAERQEVEEGGLVRNPALRREILSRVVQAATDRGFQVRGEMECPVAGQKGNVEYFLWLTVP